MTAKVFGWRGRLGRGSVLGNDIPVEETTTTTGALVDTTTMMDDVAS